MNRVIKLTLILRVSLACFACSSPKEIRRRAELEQRAESQRAREISLDDRSKKISERQKRIEGKTPFESLGEQVRDAKIEELKNKI